tara:strand:+ start:423 stop:581 length:159 start_codon:yes stop_codon:yes gene_type:complete
MLVKRSTQTPLAEGDYPVEREREIRKLKRDAFLSMSLPFQFSAFCVSGFWKN